MGDGLNAGGGYGWELMLAFGVLGNGWKFGLEEN